MAYRTRMAGPGRWRRYACWGALALGCGTTSVEAPAPQAATPSDPLVADPDDGELPPPAETPPIADEPEAEEAALEPIGVRASARTTIVYAGTNRETEVRGIIPARQPFYVYALVDADGCRGEGWARVHEDAYACIRDALENPGQPLSLPVIPQDEVVPYLYAKPRKIGGEEAVSVPRWRNRRAYRNGKEPTDSLSGDGSYAFVRRRGSKRGPVYVDDRKRAVPVEKMRRLKPSEFAGRDLAERPLPNGQTVAWTRIRDSEIVDAPSKKAKLVSNPRYHAELQVEAEPVHGDRVEWYEVVDTGHGITGFIRARDVRAFVPPPPRSDAGTSETWIDIDVGEQMLVVMRGATPTFVTLVSTGRSGDATPPGLFRIYSKKGLDHMESDEGAEDPYYVEAVPWAQYFHRDFALHAAYWHDSFGNRASHGCVNLSPRDGARLFALTSPDAPPGWISVRERWREPGTVVRVRKPGKAMPDLRTSLSRPIDPAAPPLSGNE